jgi:hypothetical protein
VFTPPLNALLVLLAITGKQRFSSGALQRQLERRKVEVRTHLAYRHGFEQYKYLIVDSRIQLMEVYSGSTAIEDLGRGSLSSQTTVSRGLLALLICSRYNSTAWDDWSMSSFA